MNEWKKYSSIIPLGSWYPGFPDSLWNSWLDGEKVALDIALVFYNLVTIRVLSCKPMPRLGQIGTRIFRNWETRILVKQDAVCWSRSKKDSERKRSWENQMCFPLFLDAKYMLLDMCEKCIFWRGLWGCSSISKTLAERMNRACLIQIRFWIRIDIDRESCNNVRTNEYRKEKRENSTPSD